MLNKFITYLILSFLTIYIINSHIANAQSVTFKFQPPDGYREIQSTDSTIELYIDGEKKITDNNISKTLISYQSTDNGYKIVHLLQSVDSKRNGELVSSPINDVLIGKEVSFTVDKKGNLLSIEGYDTLLEDIKKVVSPKMQDILSKLLDPETIKKKTTTEWSGRISDFSGKQVKQGDKWASVSEYKVKNETLKYLIITEFSEFSDNSIRVDFSYTTDKNGISKILKELNKDIVKNINTDDFSSNDSSVTGSGHRIINPNTMIIKEEMVQRTIESKISTKDRSEHLTKRIEKRNYKFEEVK